uniref:Pancreatic trypsin inhibitor n=1 Tax=Rhipicephalus zambeziensis TaxID=60191 RepID=A0A224Y2K4_9ACAR
MKVSLFVLLTGLSCLFFVEGRIQWKPVTKKPTGKDGPCNLPPDTGLCKASIPKFYFNSTVRKCLIFTYGGCGGNENNFASEHECKQRCSKWKPAPTKPPGKNDTCNLPPEKGLCRASISMFYFNSTANKCMVFKYGGCGGNENKFHSKEDCELKCGKKMECKPAVCNMPPAVGPCKASIPRLYYNSTVNQCLEFRYGGCGGNGNNFDSKQKCKEHCGKKQVCNATTSNTTEKPEVCEMPRQAGPCKAYMPRYYFNRVLKRCLQFIYGGCRGNENNFESKLECEKKCARKELWKPAPSQPTGKPIACSLPPVTGNCKYSKETDSCRISKQKGKPCTGKLNLATALWYFDTSYEKCKKYEYWKCGGNMTMFSSCSECVNTCRTHMKSLQVCTKEKLPK